jgi:hypothetical protein
MVHRHVEALLWDAMLPPGVQKEIQELEGAAGVWLQYLNS